jgi:hypothetical protein
MVEMGPVPEGAGVEGRSDDVEVAVTATGGATSEGAGVEGGSDDAEVAGAGCRRRHVHGRRHVLRRCRQGWRE